MGRKRLDILDVKDSSLSLLLADFHICQYCHIVDKDTNRQEVGSLCPNCKKPSPGGQMFFNISVHSVINLMQEFFHKDHGASESEESFNFDRSRNAKIGVVIFFVTLREVLLNNLLYDLMRTQNLPANVCKRLFSDSCTHQQRLDKLFPSLSGMKWKKAVETINNNSEIDYVEVDKFIRNVVKARNEFLHEGKKWAIKNEMAEECMKNIWPLLNLYVSLHNYFIVPLYSKE